MVNLIDKWGVRPICIVGIVTGIHSLVYGFGYIFGAGGFAETVLYPNVAELMNPVFFGVVLLVISLITIAGYFLENNEMVSWGSVVQSVIWLFATFVYFLNGAWLLGIGIGLVWSFLSGFCSFMYINRTHFIDRLVFNRLTEE